MNSWFYIVYPFFLITAFLIYFKVAHKYKIVDLPNHRTMHEGATIRGGGIVIFIAVALFSLFLENPGNYFVAGLSILGITGFVDDLVDLSGKVRFPLQALSIVCILAELNLFSLPLLWLLMIVILATGTLNAFNFMDGINGITGGYGLVTVVFLVYVNNYIQCFIPNDFLYFFILSLIIFNFYNFRKKAVCFAGDVGSLTIAFIIIYLIIKLIIETHQVGFILFLTLYGIDTIFTIVQRILKIENIFEAHRLHLFQVAVSKTGMSHLRMSGIYMFAQASINVLVIVIISLNFRHQLIYSGIMLLVLSVFYIVGKYKLIQRTS
jgi:UDP-N-acetylmuramyl pentapeptide phosphotransferase/UDP-N-acetylglucosamine-1-phosphate transferase